MTVLVDTGVLYAEHDTDATRNETATAAVEKAREGTLGQPYISDYIYDEAVTLTLERGGDHGEAAKLGKRLRGIGPYPSVYERLRVSAATFNDAVDVFEGYDDQKLSFTDATTIALVNRHDIDRVLSFDDGFDGLIDRLDPESV